MSTNTETRDFTVESPGGPNGKLGSGPGLQDPDDPMQFSEQREKEHLEKVADTVGSGPSIRTQSEGRPHYEHSEYHNTLTQNGHTNDSIHSQASETGNKRRRAISSARKKIGLEAEAPILQEHLQHQTLAWSSVRMTLREPLAEFFGTFVMVLFGDGSVAQVVLSTGDTTAPGGAGFGSYQSINWGWGLGVMLGIYVAGDSGGFLNPAVTLCFCIFRKLPWRRFPIYFLAQLLGGFCASGVVYANYINAINSVEGHGIRTVAPSSTATAGIFCTYPQPFMTKASQFFSEFIASAILMFVIFALKDDSNPGAMGKSGAGPFFPLALLFLIFGLGACFGWETGYAINLARDFGPRLMSYIVGYGHEVWSAGGYYFWIPMVAPFLGAIFGSSMYDVALYTGPDSPINTPWLGFKYLLSGGHWRKRREPNEYDV